VDSGVTHNHYTRLEKLARDKHSSLLRTFVNYGHKKFYNVEPRPRIEPYTVCPQTLDYSVNDKLCRLTRYDINYDRKNVCECVPQFAIFAPKVSNDKQLLS